MAIVYILDNELICHFSLQYAHFKNITKNIGSITRNLIFDSFVTICSIKNLKLINEVLVNIFLAQTCFKWWTDLSLSFAKVPYIHQDLEFDFDFEILKAFFHTYSNLLKKALTKIKLHVNLLMSNKIKCL